MGVLEKFDVEMIGATAEAIDKAEDRELFREAMTKIGLETPRSHQIKTLAQALEALEDIGLPAIIRPSFTLGGTGGGIAYNKDEFIEIVERGIDASPTNEVLIEEIGARLEGIRDGGGPRQEGQLHHHLLDREPRSDGRPHRRLDHRRAGADADRQGIPDHARRLDRGAARDRRRDRRLERAVRGQSGGRPPRRHRDEPAGVALLGAASKATGFPIAKVAAKLAVGYTLDEIANDITGGATPASFEPTIDYVVTKIPRFAFEKFPGAEPMLTTSMKSVGEAMAIGRTFQESLQKALRSLETGLTGLDEITIEGLGQGDDKNAIRAALGTPTPGPPAQGRAGDAARLHRRRDPRRLQDRSVVPGADARHRRDRGARSAPRACRRPPARSGG